MTVVFLPRHIAQKLVIAPSLQYPLRRQERSALGGREKLFFSHCLQLRSKPGYPEETGVCGVNGFRGPRRSILRGGRESCQGMVEMFSMEIYQKAFHGRTNCSEERQLDDPLP